MPDFLKLPTERVEQLRALSKARDLSIADLIAEYVRQQIELGWLPDAVPRISVKRSRDKVTIDFGDFSKPLHLELARAFAKALRLFATPRSLGMQGAIRELSESLSGAGVVGISRQGAAIKISGDGGKHRILAPSVVIDLARVIDTAASD